MKFRKKPVEAFHYLPDSDHNFATVDWLEDALLEVGRPPGIRFLHIRSDGGILLVLPCDWVIRDATGRLCVCKPDIFEATYERVEE